MTIYGYVRVSTLEQNEERQLIEIRKQGIKDENIFTDKQSGKDFDRPKYKELKTRLKENDVLFVLSIDRLGRNYEEIQEQWRILTKEIKADVCVIDMPLLDTRREKDLLGTFVADLVLQILSFTSESERNSIKIRQKQGIEAAKARGVRFGRKPKPIPDNFFEVCNAWFAKEITVSQAAVACGMPQTTFFEKAKSYKKIRKQ
ncbi:MAG: recombinase family protein [Lachnospiraceae bacterium]|nr:recombinase family protein [Lachnospiraceae bacterium]